MPTDAPHTAETRNPNRIRELREANNQSRAELAFRMGVDQSTVFRWENGLGAIPDQRKVALAAHFGVTVGWLMRWDTVPAPPEAA